MVANRPNPLLALALFPLAGMHGAAVSQPRVVSLTPLDGASFLVGQKFDLRVEEKGEGPLSAEGGDGE
jgi:hypothetical protein